MVPVAVQVVLHCHVEQQAHMGISDSIEDLSTLLPGFHQTGKSKLAQLVAGSRFAHLNEAREITHT